MGGLQVLNSIFLNNSAVGDGGGIESRRSCEITNTLFQGNSSGASGGGLFANGDLFVNAATFAGNTAGVGGAGVEVETTRPGAAGWTIINATLTGNRALNAGSAHGGGVDAPAVFAGSLLLLNDTINGNAADNGGGVFWAGTAGSSVTVQSNIVAQNTATTVGPDAENVAASFTDNGGNLIGAAGGAAGNIGFANANTHVGSLAAPLNPLLGPLANNGGPTVGAPGASTSLDTEALLPGSPAQYAGEQVTSTLTSDALVASAVTMDERGTARPDPDAGRTPDAGAFQVQNNDLTLTLTQTGVPAGVSGVATFAVTVINTGVNALPADNSTVTVTLPTTLTAAGPLTFTVGPLEPGQSQTFVVTATLAALGPQTVTATLTSPDAKLNSVSTNGTVVALTAQENVVQALYLDELGRTGTVAELDFWAGVLNQTSQFNVANTILSSAEARDYLVKGWYQTFLGRQAQGGEEMSWVNLLLQGQTEEQVLSQILGTAEFFNHAQTLGNPGTPNQQYVEALYQLLLNRAGDPGGVSFWAGQPGVALAFLTGSEYRTDAVTGYYNNLLHRPPDAMGLAGWVDSTLDLASVRVQVESTGEFFTNG